MGSCKNRLAEAVLRCTHNQCFEQIYEIYPNFSFTLFHFYRLTGIAEKNICILLHRQVFIMLCTVSVHFRYQKYDIDNSYSSHIKIPKTCNTRSFKSNFS